MIDTIENEQLLLGALLRNNSGIFEIDLTSKDFHPQHAEILNRIQKVWTERGKVGVLDFTDWQMIDDFTADGVNGADYIRSLHDNIISYSSESIRHYAETIKEARRKESLLELMETIKGQIAGQSYAEASAMILDEIHQENPKTGVLTGDDIFNRIIEGMRLPPQFSPTGIDRLDQSLGGGFYKGFTYGFCGAEKSGKTTLAHTISYNLAKQGEKHLYVALEMGAEQIEQRNIARDLKINSICFLDKRDSVARGIVGLKPRENLFYMDAPGSSLSEILNGIMQAKLKHGILGYIVDYWQLVGGQAPKETEEKHLRHVAQTFANFSRKHGLWCVLLAQMNQDGKLFGGNGLRKACDQLYMIENGDFDAEVLRYLRMDASRYTMRQDVGKPEAPSLELQKRIGPYFEEIN